MVSEILRFVSVRKPIVTSKTDSGVGPILLVSSENPSKFFLELLKIKKIGGGRDQFEKVAEAYQASDSCAVGRKSIPLDVAKIDEIFLTMSGEIRRDVVSGFVQSAFDISLEALLSGGPYGESMQRLRDTVLAQAIVPKERSETAKAARWLRLLDCLACLPERISKTQLLARIFLLPDQIFPLPSTINLQDAVNNEANDVRKRIYASTIDNALKISKSIELNQSAIAELSTALMVDTYELRKAEVGSMGHHTAAVVATGNTANAMVAHGSGRIPVPTGMPKPAAAGGIAVLSRIAVGSLSDHTKSVLKKLRVTDDFVDVAYAVAALESDIAKAGQTLHTAGDGTKTMALIGNQWIPVANAHLVSASPGFSWTKPGPCADITFDTPVGTTPTVPPTTQSDIRPIGIADLMQIRQSVQRYELGEIAHVENVMKAEIRDRTRIDSTKVTKTEFIETERTVEDSRDLQTTDRFELQQEANEIVREESTREVALSLSVSYGPFVEGNADITAGQSESREQSNRNAVRYSREVTDKAVRKVQERVLTRRSIVTETTVEETNKHIFDNKDGDGHICGIYRWIDKIYKAQVVSYGLRMVFEAVVPEPAAFYKFALGAAPREGVRLKAPVAPGYCTQPDHLFTPLQPRDLHEGNYQFWVSQYGATDVVPPPPLYRTIGIAAAEEAKSNDVVYTYTNTELQVPEGYVAERAFVRGSAPITVFDANNWFTTFHIGRSHLAAGQSAPMNGEDGVIPVVGHGFNVHALAFTVEVLCVRSKETYAAWQLATYTKIMASYNDIKTQYEAALSRSQVTLQNNAAMFGNSPEQSRDIERNELKRAFISMITGQHFDLFDAMRRNVPSFGYPQMDIADAMAEGEYIKFFEQSIEWSNMSYRFYPYFWGQKAEWPKSFQHDAADPLFAKFLQSGAARLQIPIRPGFENAVLYFLQTGNKPWETDEHGFAVQGTSYISMVDEIREEQLGAFNKGVGTVAVRAGSANVVGSGTVFDRALHIDRDIEIQRRRYRVVDVVSATQLTLDRTFIDDDADAIEYSFGARLVGDPWELRVPTQLVMLQDDAALPDLNIQ